MLSASDTIERLGGIARGTQLQSLGFDRRALARLVDAAILDRVRPGVFAAPGLAPDIRTATEHGGALTCVSALRRRGIWVLSESHTPHVWVGAGRHAHQHPKCDCVSHHFRGRPPLGTVDVRTALLHLRHCAGDEAFFAAFESAWRKRLISRTDRARIRASLPRNARWLVDFARPDADSGLESLLRLRLRILGIQLECQVSIAGVGRVDFVLAGRIILEVDGRENHDGASLRHKDLVRDAAASRLGYETLRFDYAQVLYDWPSVQAAIVGALRRTR